MSNHTCISTGHQLNISSLDKSSTVCQLTSTGQLVTGNYQEYYWNTSEDTLLDVWGAT